ncbi:hypothetical protein L596_015057 [Steinernema carpocapsae]|uniref:aECM cysteine-cradle domain-containing protein n=1 Tax=Steinernema carpocapsae TaxID=34508 RepID=A0A4V6A300_STECR|nr:hypothetical protein L596_015057 [Steinernema carpocapsae]
MRSLSLLLLVSLVLLCSTSRALRGYHERIKAMREAINERETSALSVPTSSLSKSFKSNPQKVKKYKCVLVEEDEEESISQEAPKPVSSEALDFDYGTPVEKTNHNQLWPAASNSLPKHSLSQKTILKQHNVPVPEHNQFRAPEPVPSPIEYPKARAMPKAKAMAPVETFQKLPQPPVVTTMHPNVPTDKNHQPLILSPEHCQQIKYYANMYGVQDVKTWVHKNCAFAKMYLPKATCAEIDVLVASCY